jgi:hypothetical protein
MLMNPRLFNNSFFHALQYNSQTITNTAPFLRTVLFVLRSFYF